MLKRLIALAKESWKTFSSARAASRGAAISFYTVTSIVPLLLMVIAIASLAFGHDAASEALFAQFKGLIGDEGAKILENAVSSSSKTAGVLATLVSVGTLLFTASGIFLELQDALNTIWGAKRKEGLSYLVRARALSIGLVIALGFLLVVSLVIDAMLTKMGGVIEAHIPFGKAVLFILNGLISLALLTVVFAAIIKVITAAKVAWNDVLEGAAFTAVMFVAGKFLIGLYLGSSATITSLGAAGALLGLLFWVYYTSQIFLFGAAVTRAHAVGRDAATANAKGEKSRADVSQVEAQRRRRRS